MKYVSHSNFHQLSLLIDVFFGCSYANLGRGIVRMLSLMCCRDLSMTVTNRKIESRQTTGLPGLVFRTLGEFIFTFIILTLKLVRRVAMALVESVAAFEQRCDELNPAGNIKVGLRNQGVTCFSLLAFAVGSPQAPPSEAELTAFAQTVYGAVPTIGQLANLKRLYFEATTLVIASLKQSVANETTDQQVTLKKLPIADQRRKLHGWVV